MDEVAKPMEITETSNPFAWYVWQIDRSTCSLDRNESVVGEIFKTLNKSRVNTSNLMQYKAPMWYSAESDNLIYTPGYDH